VDFTGPAARRRGRYPRLPLIKVASDSCATGIGWKLPTPGVVVPLPVVDWAMRPLIQGSETNLILSVESFCSDNPGQ
jgi:hypothetical protein